MTSKKERIEINECLIENKIMEYDLKLALEYEKGNEKEK